MARYWIYLNDQVMGPYELEQLIRVPGFSRRSMVSVDDYSGGVGRWISPAEIPELARIFQKADELHEAPIPAPRPAAKPARPRMPTHLTPVAPPVEEKKKFPTGWLWLVALAALAGGAYYWTQTNQRRNLAGQRQLAQNLVETVPLPSSSQYGTVRQYVHAKQITPRWEFEQTPSGLYNVTVSWKSPEPSEVQVPVYALEVNLQAQTVRGLNTAGTQLLARGFPPPAAPVAKAAPAKSQRSPGDTFPGAINDRRQAFEQADFETVWESFSKRRKQEMSQGGMNQVGFVRMQKLAFRNSPGVQQTIVKTKQESDTERLVLLRQTQSKHPDIFIKQTWIWEDNSWRLDEEDKKMADGATTSPSEPPAPAPEASSAPAPEPKAPPAAVPALPPGLPGLSDSPR